MVFHWRLSDNKSSQVSRTLLSILAYLSNGCSLDSLHSSRYFQVLQSLYSAFDDCTKSTNYSWYDRHFHVPQFFQFPSKVQVLIVLFTFFQFYSVISRESKVHNSSGSLFFLFFLLIITRSGRLAEIRSSVCISKYQMSLCVSFSKTDFGLCIYHLFVWSNLHSS